MVVNFSLTASFWTYLRPNVQKMRSSAERTVSWAHYLWSPVGLVVFASRQSHLNSWCRPRRRGSHQRHPWEGRQNVTCSDKGGILNS